MKKWHGIFIFLAVLCQSFGAVSLFNVSMIQLGIGFMALGLVSIQNFRPFIFLLIFVSYGLILFLFDQSNNRFYYTSFIIYGLASATLSYQLTKVDANLSRRLVLLSILITSSITLLSLFINSGVLPDLAFIKFPEMLRYDELLFGGGFGNPNNNASIIFAMLVLLFVSDKSPGRVEISAAMLAYVCIIISGSRYFITASTLFIFVWSIAKIRGVNLALFLGFILLAAINLQNLVSDNDYLSLKLSSTQDIYFEDTMSKRVDFLNRFFDFNWVPFGLPLNSASETWESPHSLLLDFSFIFGVPGFILFAVVAIFMFNKSMKKSGLIGFISFLLLYGGTHIPSSLITSPLFFTLIGLYMSAVQGTKCNINSPESKIGFIAGADRRIANK